MGPLGARPASSGARAAGPPARWLPRRAHGVASTVLVTRRPSPRIRPMAADPPPLDAFVVAAELFGDVPLTTEQLTQLRALDHRYWQEVYTMLHPDGEAPRPALTAAQRTELHAMLARAVRELATATQRAEFDSR